jgi:hypothetical protein
VPIPTPDDQPAVAVPVAIQPVAAAPGPVDVGQGQEGFDVGQAPGSGPAAAPRSRQAPEASNSSSSESKSSVVIFLAVGGGLLLFVTICFPQSWIRRCRSARRFDVGRPRLAWTSNGKQLEAAQEEENKAKIARAFTVLSNSESDIIGDGANKAVNHTLQTDQDGDALGVFTTLNDLEASRSESSSAGNGLPSAFLNIPTSREETIVDSNVDTTANSWDLGNQWSRVKSRLSERFTALKVSVSSNNAPINTYDSSGDNTRGMESGISMESDDEFALSRQAALSSFELNVQNNSVDGSPMNSMDEIIGSNQWWQLPSGDINKSGRGTLYPIDEQME